MFRLFKKLVLCILTLAIAVLQIGCSAFAGSKQKLSVTASEQDAQIYVNGNMVGSGSVHTSVKRDQSVSVMVKKDGFLPASRDIGTEMSFTGILDIIGGCFFLLPFIGLAFPGAHALDQNNISVILQKDAK